MPGWVHEEALVAPMIVQWTDSALVTLREFVLEGKLIFFSRDEFDEIKLAIEEVFFFVSFFFFSFSFSSFHSI